MLTRVLALTVALLTTAVPALADNLLLTFTDSAGTGSVSLDATSRVSPGVYRVTSASGTINGTAILSLVPAGLYPSDIPNNNLVYFPVSLTVPAFDDSGISFLLADGQYFNLFSFPSGFRYVTGNSLDDENGPFPVTRVTLTQTGQLPRQTSVTPEPSSLALLGTGLMGVVGAARRRFA